MAIDETARFELHEALREELGMENGDNLMSMLPPVGWADVATKQDLAHLAEKLDNMATKADLAALGEQLHKEINRQTWSMLGLFVAVGALLTANNIW